ncbi:hypothetical protein Tco_1531543 [Tanacetum coccineum]
MVCSMLMAVPKDHLRRFHGMDDAKEIWAAIKTRFGGNANSKKMQKAVLKQQFEAFTISSKESLEKGYDRFQKLLSQLDALGASVSDEDANHKFLRSLPPAWDSLANLVFDDVAFVKELGHFNLFSISQKMPGHHLILPYHMSPPPSHDTAAEALNALSGKKILTNDASEGFKGSQAPLGSKIYKRKSKSTKTPTKILHFEEPDSAQVNTAQVNTAQVNTAELNPDSTSSAQINTGEVNAAEVNTGEVNAAALVNDGETEKGFKGEKERSQ